MEEKGKGISDCSFSLALPFICGLSAGVQDTNMTITTFFNSKLLFSQSCLTLCESHGLQHARLPCSLQTPPGVCSRFFPISWLFTSGGQSTGTQPQSFQ